MSHYPYIVVGAGIAGSVLAQCLRQKNMAVAVFERAKQSSTRNNYGITLSERTYRSLLDLLKISESEFQRQVAVHSPRVGTGAALLKGDSKAIQDDTSLRVNRVSLLNLLRQDLDIKWEHSLTAVGETPNSDLVSCKFQHGTEEQGYTFSVLFGADGVHSTTRSFLKSSESGFQCKVLPYVVFNGKRRLAIKDASDELLTRCFRLPNGMTHVKNNVVLSIKPDFHDTESKMIGISYTLSRPAGEGDNSLLNRSVNEAEKLAERFVTEVSMLGELPRPFDEVFKTEVMGKDRLLHWLMRSSLLQAPLAQSSQTQSTGNVILLGDAAHAQPIPGNGANEAIEDALGFSKHIRVENGSLHIDERAINERSKHWVRARQDSEQAMHDMHFGRRQASI